MVSAPSIAYLNGRFLPLPETAVSPLDRGFLFADGVYEVIPVYHNYPFRLSQHITRLFTSLAAIRLDMSADRNEIERILRELIARNGGGNLALYLQITRGASPIRDHGFPKAVSPTVFAMCNPLKPMAENIHRNGISAITTPDIRWSNCHLKTIALLPSVLARQQALEQGADDALLVRDGYLTEASAANLFIIKDSVIHTPIKDHRILPGITRDLLLELAAANGIPCAETNLPVEGLNSADEVWISSSTKEIVPVTKIDGRPVGSGSPGSLWRRINELLQDYKRAACLTTSELS